MMKDPTNADRRGPVVNRRRALALTGAATAGALAAPAVARAADQITWKMVTSWPKNAPGVGVNAQRVADMITEMSGGRLTVHLFAAGEMVPPFECFDAVSAGTAEIMHATPYYWQGKDKAFHFFTGIPFGLTAVEHAAWLEFGGGQALWDKAYAPFGVIPFYSGSSGVQAGGWFRKEISSLEDFKGLKMRIAGLGGEVMRRLGVNVVLLPPGEIFQAMDAGTIDAAEWVGPWNDLAFGLYRVANYYYMPAFHELGPALEVSVNKAAYEALPDDLKSIVRHAAAANCMQATADFTYHNAVSLKPLLAKEGVELKFMPDDVITALAKESEMVLKEIGDTSPLAGEIYQSFTKYRAEAAAYAKVSDQAALEMRAKALGI